jgi:hypothetical protein
VRLLLLLSAILAALTGGPGVRAPAQPVAAAAQVAAAAVAAPRALLRGLPFANEVAAPLVALRAAFLFASRPLFAERRRE